MPAIFGKIAQLTKMARASILSSRILREKTCSASKSVSCPHYARRLFSKTTHDCSPFAGLSVCRKHAALCGHLNFTGRRSSDWCVVHPEVREAMLSDRPVVALETAIVTHGMPHPHNYEVAEKVEQVVRSNGAVPASIGMLRGRVHVGLTPEELAILADSSTDKIKISRRDFPFAFSQRCSGGTTVSGTMLVAHKVGIPLFVTGGIGGVHRGGESSMDVSADLMELGRTPVGVVCAGAKSILDIGRTLEVLETNGVCVVTYGEGQDFPAFFSRSSGHKSPYRVDSIEDCASLVDQCFQFNSGTGVLISVPIPKDSAAVGSEIETAIQTAAQEAEATGIHGRDLTPFILSRVNDVTEGKSLEANIALIKNNAAVGSGIAVRLAELRKARNLAETYPPVPTSHLHPNVPSGVNFVKGPSISIINNSSSSSSSERNFKRPVVVGGAIFDLTAKLQSPQLLRNGTNPGSLSTSLGGVGRNVAEVLGRLGTEPLFVSTVGRDDPGRAVLKNLENLNLSTEGVFVHPSASTASYCIVLDHLGEMFCGIGDTACCELVGPEVVMRHADAIRAAPLVVADANVPVDSLRTLCSLCSEAGVPVLYEPTAVQKACRIVEAGVHGAVTHSTPNLAELIDMHSAISRTSHIDTEDVEDLTREEKISKCLQHIPYMIDHIPNLYVKLGCDGVVLGRRDESSSRGYSIWYYQAASSHLLPVNVASVSGAGDSFVGALVSSIIYQKSTEIAVKSGLRAAYMSLLSQPAISEDLCLELFSQSAVSNWAPWKPVKLV